MGFQHTAFLRVGKKKDTISAKSPFAAFKDGADNIGATGHGSQPFGKVVKRTDFMFPPLGGLGLPAYSRRDIAEQNTDT